MQPEKTRLVVVVGSVREGRLGPAVADWYAGHANRSGQFSVDVLDLAEASLPAMLADEAPAEVNALRGRLEEADAFVFVTPEYNRSFPASLKNAIDWYLPEWSAKPVGLVSYGGVGAGIRATEALRPVLTAVNAVAIRETVSVQNVSAAMDPAGHFVAPDLLDHAVKLQLDHLLWWALALRDARVRRPFAAG